MDTAIVLFTRDLRLHDNPALRQARDRARQVVPLFVADPALDATKRSPNRPGASATRAPSWSSASRPGLSPDRIGPGRDPSTWAFVSNGSHEQA